MTDLLKTIRRSSAIVVMMLMFCLASQAQNITVKGHVADSKGEEVIGASVLIKGSKGVGTVTDIDGNFVLQVPSENSTLQFSYVGMLPQEVKVGKERNFNVTLLDDNQVMNEVVVVGYGQQKKESVVGSITQTSGKVLERAGGVTSIGAALTGNVPGVVTMSSTGMPGEEDPKIVIRGVSSWNNSDPLILVDGIERPMGSIDISSVQSVSVLKDASATAVYGVRGANGVILITTKRGQEGKAKIEVGMNATLKYASKLPGSLHSADALTIRNQAAEHELGLMPDSWSKVLPMDLIDKYRYHNSIEDAERYPDVDWQKEVFKNHAMAYNPHITVSGGTNFVKYFAAIDYLHEGDLFRQWDNNRGYKTGYGFDRINARSNLDFKLTKTTQLKVNLFGSHGIRKGPWGLATGSYGESQLWAAAYSAPRDAFVPRYSDGTWGYNPSYTDDEAPNSVRILALSGSEKHTTTRINTDFTLTQNLDFITKGLKASALVSWDNVFQEDKRGINDLYHDAQYKWINPQTGEAIYKQPQDSKTNFDFQEGILWNTEGGTVNNGATVRNLFYQLQLNWARKFGKHDITAMGVFNRTENSIGSDFKHYREDWAFRTTYNYDGRYFFEYNGAYNGSEQFGPKNRFDWFNSAAVGYTISEEKFWTNIRKYVDMLKFRYSIGEVGDDGANLGRWLYSTQWAYGGTTTQGLNGENSPYTWYREAKIGNPDIHWEKSTKQNFGVDYSFLHGLVAGSFDYFIDNRKDVLIAGSDRSIPSYFGATAPPANLGKVRTRGFELEVRLSKNFGEHHLWGNFSMTHATNKILKYDDPSLLPDYQKKQGFSIGQDHAFLTTGFANTWDDVIGITRYNTNDSQKLPGMYDVVDYNGDGVIDSNDSAPYGYTSIPENTFNATIGWDWKGFSCYLQFYGVTNVDRYVAFNSLTRNLDTVFDEGSFWTKYSITADAPMPRINSTPSYYEGTRFHYDGSFIRLKNAEIAYTFTQKWVKTLGLESLRVFVNGNNLWVWSRMPDDRESNFAGTGLASQGAYPTVKRVNFGLKINL